MAEEDIRGLLERVYEKIAREKEHKPYRTKLVKADSPHGIYFFDKKLKEWALVKRDGGPISFEKDGFYVIYFDNAKCPACRIYDLFWYPFVETVGVNLESVEFIIVYCEWFARNCQSEAAASSFKEYEVKASPTTAFIEVRNGGVLKKELKSGVMRIEELAKKVVELTGIKLQ
ncbi:MAG: hypothetical protein N3E36_04215 [Sulfolobales archaeon]|nr:hypothetical protein [Sulfolobales archaeon]MCX8199219.1 hypothetical protein [Sulfolobales archaeon]MDW8170199.1 hypothetical protein [Desulfurococcaceae archaeon]